MDTILKVIVLIVSAWFAYVIMRAERGGRAWAPSSLVAAFLMLFGGVAFGLLRIESYFAPKLIDAENLRFIGDTGSATLTSASDTDLFVGGVIVIAVVVVLALDLLGKIDVMSKVNEAIANAANKGTTPSGD